MRRLNRWWKTRQEALGLWLDSIPRAPTPGTVTYGTTPTPPLTEEETDAMAAYLSGLSGPAADAERRTRKPKPKPKPSGSETP